MEVNFKNYQALANRTMASLGSKAVDGAHMALGFTTELGELDLALFNRDNRNLIEEHGDTNWYIANACEIYGLSFESIFKTATLKNNLGVFYLHDLVDLFKRELAYKKEMNIVELTTQLTKLVQYLITISQIHDFPYQESIQINIDKLNARYPEKFTEEAALVRNLEVEHKIIEG